MYLGKIEHIQGVSPIWIENGQNEKLTKATHEEKQKLKFLHDN